VSVINCHHTFHNDPAERRSQENDCLRGISRGTLRNVETSDSESSSWPYSLVVRSAQFKKAIFKVFLQSWAQTKSIAVFH
jgi:hypothetical protein